jgi:anti-sigma B factor antagonist
MYNIQLDGESATLVLSGDVDLQTTADLKNEISELVGISSLDIKAGRVSYIDSSGVAVLLMTRQHCILNGIEMSLSVISNPVFRVLQIAKLDKLLPIGDIVDGDGNGVNSAAADNFGIDAPQGDGSGNE